MLVLHLTFTLNLVQSYIRLLVQTQIVQPSGSSSLLDIETYPIHSFSILDNQINEYLFFVNCKIYKITQ